MLVVTNCDIFKAIWLVVLQKIPLHLQSHLRQQCVARYHSKEAFLQISCSFFFFFFYKAPQCFLSWGCLEALRLSAAYLLAFTAAWRMPSCVSKAVARQLTATCVTLCTAPPSHNVSIFWVIFCCFVALFFSRPSCFICRSSIQSTFPLKLCWTSLRQDKLHLCCVSHIFHFYVSPCINVFLF